MNKVELYGRLTKDPEVRTTASGKNVTGFTLAVNRNVSKDAGANVQKADFIPCSAWGKTGETVAKYCKKGHRLLVEGSLEINNFTGKDGQRRSMTNIFVSNITLVETRSEAGAPAAAPSARSAAKGSTAPYDAPFDEEVPF